MCCCYMQHRTWYWAKPRNWYIIMSPCPTYYVPPIHVHKYVFVVIVWFLEYAHWMVVLFVFYRANASKGSQWSQVESISSMQKQGWATCTWLSLPWFWRDMPRLPRSTALRNTNRIWGYTRFNGLPFADVLEKVKLRACLPELLPRHCRFRRKLAEQNTKTQTKPRQLNFRMVRQELALMVQDHVEPLQQSAKGKSPLV